MALTQLLTAITAQADQQIALIRQEQERTLKAARDDHERSLAISLQAIDARKQQKMDHLRKKTEQHAAAFRNNSVLRHKRSLLDRAYESVARSLSQAPDTAVEPLLKRCLEMAGSGEVRPAARHRSLIERLLPSSCSPGPSIETDGGFLCVSDKQEHDFRFATIIHDLLRPLTEIHAAESLFPSVRA